MFYSNKLPVLQGPSAMFLLLYLAAKSDPTWGCDTASLNATASLTSESNVTNYEGPWMDNWRKTQGSLMIASILHITVGMFGLGGLLLRIVGPLPITVMLTLLGLSIQPFVAAMAESSWPVAIFSMFVAVVCSRYIHTISIPFPMWRLKKGLTIIRYPFFQLFPALVSVLLSWLLSYILTISGAFTNDPTDVGYNARTDVSIDLIHNATIFTLPYPGQYGRFEISSNFLISFLISSLGSILESLGDYVQTAYACATSVPPPHAINRGILMEGISTLMSGLFGAGYATTSFSKMIGLIIATKVASRSVMVLSAVILIGMATLGHVTAVLVNIPKPALAGSTFLGIALLIASAISNLKQVDLTKQRNVTVLGIAMLAGTMIPAWIQKNPTATKTGEEQVDMLLHTFLSAPLIVGGSLACLLDATLPGSRSRHPHNITTSSSTDASNTSNVYGMKCMSILLQKVPFLGKLPIFPDYKNTIAPHQMSTQSETVTGVESTRF